MGRKKKDEAAPKELSPREQEIAQLRAVPRGERSEGDVNRLAELQAQERRDRWERLSPGRFKRLRASLKGLLQLSNPASYQYTPEEAEALVKRFEARAKEVRAAFLGAPEEKSLIDL